MRFLAGLLFVLVACGGDDPPKPTPVPAAPAPAAPAPGAPGTPGAGSGSGKPLPPMLHAEDRVQCPPPRTGSKKCDPNATKPVEIGTGAKPKDDDLVCAEPDVCLPTSDQGYLCGPCPERFTIRHEFKDRDFAGETNRDPFLPAIGKLPGAGSSAGTDDVPKDPTSRCVRAEQMRVTNYGYQDLKLVGIVSQGTQRKVLMMDPGNYGHIIKRGDCVGKEKAWVKDIGENFICFEMSQEQATAARLPEGQCVELHNKQLSVSQLPIPDQPSVAPVLPSQTGPAVPAQPRGPTTSTTTTITPMPAPVRPAPVQPAPTGPSQAPTNLRP